MHWTMTRLQGRISVALMAACILCTLCVASPCAAQDQDLGMQANLEDVLLVDFIRFVGKYTGRNIVYRADQIPPIKFNIYSQKPINDVGLMAIFQQVLSNAGLSAVAKDDAVYIYPIKDALQIGGTFKSKLGDASVYPEEMVTSVYQLRKNISAQTAASALKGLLSQIGTITALPQAQAVVITDTQDRTANIMDIVRSIESLRSQWDFEILPLQQADSEKVIKVLNDMYKALKDRGEVAEGMPLLAAVPWSNSILVSGTPEQKTNIREFLVRMDRVERRDDGLIRIYRLQNAEASSVASVLQSLMEAKIKKQEQEEKVTVSDVFKVSADAKTNSLVVLSSKDIFPQVENIITDLDRPLNQVYVEALVLETTLSNSRRFGVEWMVGGGNNNNLGQTGFLDNNSGNSPLMNWANPAFDGDPPNFSAMPGGFSMGILGNILTYNDQRFPTINALVNFSKNIDQINILSTPQIMTLDHSEAEVFVGENRPFKTGEVTNTTSESVTATYDYRDVGVKLTITPHINAEQKLIRLDVYQEVKTVGTSADESLPRTLTRYTKTSVQLMDGSTMVISGLVQDNTQQGKVGMPGLASLPVLGWLFKRDSSQFDKNTIMVFLTARIIHTLETANTLTQAKRQSADEAKEKAKDRYEKEFETFRWNDPSAEDETPATTDDAGAVQESQPAAQ